ncbi:MAG: OB-fold putative lipoprotein [Microscillaceae bacterium]|jgi:CRISPR/Cas system CSM-associated protein Csm4 (group 5 of RAMP superfamily)|nr:OB-fold putative lipoprotein [Microscillaceae bacterium]
MLKIFRYTGLALLLIILLGGAYATYLWNKPHRDIQAEKAEVVEAIALFKKYSEAETEANQLWLDKTLQVKGKIKEILKNQTDIPVIMLDTNDPMGNISCTMDVSQKKSAESLKVGSEVMLKGLCTGMLADVVLVKCFLVNP